jgi:hypothetical protein
MKETDLAYMAGIIDGEGSIGFYKNYINTIHEWHYNTRLSITNTDLALINWLQDTFSGKIYVIPPDKNHLGKKPVYRWHLNKKQEILNLLIDILPYLRLKKLQAELVIDYISNNLDGRGRANRERAYKHRDEIASKIKLVNSGT